MLPQNDGGQTLSLANLRNDVIGIDTLVPLLDGNERPYVFLDNAASTPTLKCVLRCVEEFLPWYSGVHRGTGFKSLLATKVFDRAHSVVGRFVGADLTHNTVIFTKNTTECVNKLSNRLDFNGEDVVVTTAMEHHSNDLPWRKHANVVHVGITEDGHLDLAALKRVLEQYAGRVKLVAINGASNITGICSPIADIAEWTHAAGSRIFVDAAQLAPHRPINMFENDDPRHIDFLALSAHKMYAPFGTGALIGPVDFFELGDPDTVGGGVVEVVTFDDVAWNHPPHKEEAGSPNVVGGVALAEAITVLQSVGMDEIASHEQDLLRYALTKIKALKGITLYGPTDNLTDKVGVIVFNIDGMHHALVAAILGTEGGIGVRNGCFCAHPYVKELLKVTPQEDRELIQEVLAGNKTRMPGMVRASIGCYNNESDIDALVDMLARIVHREYKGTYVQDVASGAFHAQGYDFGFKKYFPFFDSVEPAYHRNYSEAS
ncbi:MAG: aminotransferase class V-fold PLP-dependent enzyme [Ignavibacteria bacterium]|nr:aminotransferase class V-fold PLP-dependent enzyme [Ignavibacteria bacterium]